LPAGSILALILLLGVRVAIAVDVTECGQVIASGEVGQLRGDLECTRRPTWPYYPAGVYLSPGAALELNGFAINGDGSGIGINCAGTRRCAVTGPGEIRGFESGVSCGGCRLLVRDTIFRENTNGIYMPLSGRLVAERVRASDNAGTGIWALSLRGEDVEASRNGAAGLIAIYRLRLRGLDASHNVGPGIVAGPRRSHLEDSVAVGNDAAGDGYDIRSTGSVRLTRTTCGRSAKLRYLSQEEFKIVGSFGCAGD